MEGYLLQLQPFSVNDGEGIRTTIFLAGCPLHCSWCANPEGLTQKQKIAHYEKLCMGCGACTTVCPKGLGQNLNEKENRSQCDGCGACVKVCTKQARKAMIQKKTLDEIVTEIGKHRLFYQKSGGGITFSGGEATVQHVFLEALSQRLYDEGYHLAIETCGYFDFQLILPILQRMDLIFMDLKHMDGKIHKTFTGVDNQLILENMKQLTQLKGEIVIRIPVIMGFNGEEENIRRSAEFVKKNLPHAKMELLPYHTLGEGKYEALGISQESGLFMPPTPEDMEGFKKIVTEVGVEQEDYR